MATSCLLFSTFLHLGLTLWPSSPSTWLSGTTVYCDLSFFLWESKEEGLLCFVGKLSRRSFKQDRVEWTIVLLFTWSGMLRMLWDLAKLVLCMLLIGGVSAPPPSQLPVCGSAESLHPDWERTDSSGNAWFKPVDSRLLIDVMEWTCRLYRHYTVCVF